MPLLSAPTRRVVRPRLRALGWLAVLAVGSGAVLGACSGDPDWPPAADSAEAVLVTLRLDEASRGCLEEGFEADRGAAELLTVDAPGDPSVDEQARLAAVVVPCVSAEQLAATVADSVARAFPAATDAGTDARRDCVAGAVADLPDGDRTTLLVGLLALAASPDSELALARGEVVNGIYSACRVTDDLPVGEAPPTTG